MHNEPPTPETLNKWWARFAFPEFGGHYNMSPQCWIGLPLLQDALAGGPPILVPTAHGIIRKKPSEFVSAMSEALGMRLLRVYSPQEDSSGQYLLGSELGMADCTFENRGSWVSVDMVTADQELFDKAKAFLLNNVFPDDPASGPVYTLAKTREGYRLHRMGAAGAPLQRDNYSEGVLEAYDHIVADLNTASPCGRLIVLAGVPGTGKTFLVRSLLRESRKTTFVMISPHLVRDLGDPEILPSLTAAKDELPGPILLILEDADMCLVPRGSDNMSTISSLLNLGDGILGSLLDVRILATTNAKKIEMDPAALREGRLCRQIDVPKLHAGQANGVLKRLLNGQHKKEPFAESATLAEVYHRARKHGWSPEETAKPEMRLNKARGPV